MRLDGVLPAIAGLAAGFGVLLVAVDDGAEAPSALEGTSSIALISSTSAVTGPAAAEATPTSTATTSVSVTIDQTTTTVRTTPPASLAEGRADQPESFDPRCIRSGSWRRFDDGCFPGR